VSLRRGFSVGGSPIESRNVHAFQNIRVFVERISNGPSSSHAYVHTHTNTQIERDINRKRIKRELGGNIEIGCRWGERLRATVKLKDDEASHTPCAAGEGVPWETFSWEKRSRGGDEGGRGYAWDGVSLHRSFSVSVSPIESPIVHDFQNIRVFVERISNSSFTLCVSICAIRQHTSAGIRQKLRLYVERISNGSSPPSSRASVFAPTVSRRQHTSAYHYVSIRPHTAANVSTRQHTECPCLPRQFFCLLCQYLYFCTGKTKVHTHTNTNIERDINRKRIKRELGGNIEKGCRWGERLRATVKLKDDEASHTPCAAGEGVPWETFSWEKRSWGGDV
jgi:hypothetical protein